MVRRSWRPAAATSYGCQPPGNGRARSQPKAAAAATTYRWLTCLAPRQQARRLGRAHIAVLRSTSAYPSRKPRMSQAQRHACLHAAPTISSPLPTHVRHAPHTPSRPSHAPLLLARCISASLPSRTPLTLTHALTASSPLTPTSEPSRSSTGLTTSAPPGAPVCPTPKPWPDP